MDRRTDERMTPRRKGRHEPFTLTAQISTQACSSGRCRFSQALRQYRGNTHTHKEAHTHKHCLPQWGQPLNCSGTEHITRSPPPLAVISTVVPTAVPLQIAHQLSQPVAVPPPPAARRGTYRFPGTQLKIIISDSWHPFMLIASCSGP